MEKDQTDLLLPEIQAKSKPQDQWHEKRIPVFRNSSILEIVLFLILAVLVDEFWGNGNRFWSVNPHPFWIIVILICVQYGIKEGFLAVSLSTIVLLFNNMPEKDLGQYGFEYIFYVSREPISWTIGAFIVGGLRQRHIHRYNKLIDGYSKAEESEKLIVQKYIELKRIKESIEKRLTGQPITIMDVYETAKALTVFEPDDVIKQTGKVLSQLLSPEHYSVFLIENNELKLNVNNWPEDVSYKSSFTNDDKFFQTVMIAGKIISVFDQNERVILGNEGLLCGSFSDPDTGQIFGIIKIEKIKFKHMNSEAKERFKIICEWIGYIYAKALVFKAVTKND